MSLISRRFHDFSDHEQFYDFGTIILYDICITKFVNPSSARDFACSAGELEIESESWSLQPKAGDLASMKYCLAVDDGRRSGHGRVVLLYSELCVQIWGGSPVSTITSSGILSYHLALIFLCGYVRCSVDKRPNRNRRGAFQIFQASCA